MSLLTVIRKYTNKVLWVRKFVAYKLVPLSIVDNYFKNFQPDLGWQRRINIVLESEDNDKIGKVTGAGKIKNGKITMHNGLRINVGSYYGLELTSLLLKNNGIHEPQEEYAFSLVIPHIPGNATMIEMGSFWAFYSLWFNT